MATSVAHAPSRVLQRIRGVIRTVQLYVHPEKYTSIHIVGGRFTSDDTIRTALAQNRATDYGVPEYDGRQAARDLGLPGLTRHPDIS